MLGAHMELKGSYRARVIRKMVTLEENGQDPLIFEVGKRASKNMPSLGSISAIVFEKHRLKEEGKVFTIHIKKTNGEEVAWKELHVGKVHLEFNVM